MYASILSIVLGWTIWLWFHRSTPSTHVVDTILPYCSSGILRNVVSWSSMAPLLSDGQEIVIQTDKNCYTLMRWDIIVYDYAQDVSNANPVVKRVVGMWWDSFRYMSWHIYINDILQKSSRGETYNISSNMLALYAHDYPIIPPDTLLVLWEIPTGSRDSSSFWLISQDGIYGKAIEPTPIDTRSH